ncbi:MAG: glycosyltransferase family 2 protein [Bacteroidota bacterium]|nr:glycosyltransferase family 2 protein [Bacteroidota bacterium]
MKVSIITVTLNSEKYLLDCINSVRKQNYSDIEHIVIDGKSTDHTLKIIQDNSAYIDHWISEPDRGMYDAINKGIKLATGDIIGILNSDDAFASSGVIRNIVDCFKNTNSDSVYGDLVFVDPVNTEKITRFWKGIPYKRYRFNFGWMPAHPTFYMKRSLIQQYGFYENHYFTSADYEFMARYLYKHKIQATYLEQMVVKMRRGGASNGNIWRRLRANRRDYLAMKKNHIPFSFFVSILKPIIKIKQYSKPYLKRAEEECLPKSTSTITYLPVDGKVLSSHSEVVQ